MEFKQTQSEKIGEIAKALVKAQKQMDKVHKDSTNPFFKSKYADLSAVIDASVSILNDNGIAVLQPMERNGSDAAVIATLLIHESGEWIKGQLTIAPEKKTPQGLGSAITYGRRYSLQSMVCLAAEDDDAEGAMNRNTKKGTQQAKASFSQDQIEKGKRLQEFVEATCDGDTDAINKMIRGFGPECKFNPQRKISLYTPDEFDIIWAKYSVRVSSFEGHGKKEAA